MVAIDPDFKTKYPVSTTHVEHAVRNEELPSKRLGIHGTEVAVDFDICIADGICISVCPVNVFDWLETPGCTTPNASGQAVLAEKKADPTREKDCIFCRACEVQCPVLAIKITEP